MLGIELMILKKSHQEAIHYYLAQKFLCWDHFLEQVCFIYCYQWAFDGFSPLVGYPKWKVRCSTAAVSLSEDAKVEIDQQDSKDRQEGGKVNKEPFTIFLTSLGPSHTANNIAPNEYKGVVNSSGLVVYKGSNTTDKKGTRKSKRLKVNSGCEQWCGDWT